MQVILTVSQYSEYSIGRGPCLDLESIKIKRALTDTMCQDDIVQTNLNQLNMERWHTFIPKLKLEL